LNLALLVSWLDWKASESQIAAGALRQDSKDHLEEASNKRLGASNLASWIEVDEKSGSSESAQLKREYVQEALEKAQREESKAKDRNDEAETAEIASRFYRNAKASIGLIKRTAEEAQRSGRSFQESVGLELSPIIQEVHRRHRMRDRWAIFWLWTRRALVILVGVFFAAIALRSCGTEK
jgi:O-glycosyl hydrolase